MMSMPAADDANKPRWQPIRAIDRRVLGVLAEKAKCTPDVYPLSLNALVTGCNQKSNRHPFTQYEPEDVEASLDRLRALGAVAAVQGNSRVGRYRHYLYEWLGVEKIELSIMAELLLRGAQTEGELRGRAARMDPLPDLAALRTLLDSLKAKGLVQALTPEGRGQIISHTLYLPEELEKVRRQIAGIPGGPPTSATSDTDDDDQEEAAEPEPRTGAVAPPPRDPPPRAPTASAPATASGDELAALKHEVAELRNALAEVRGELKDLAAREGRNADELDRLRRALGE